MAEEDVKEPTFHEELCSLINRRSMGNKSNTPDFLLARYMESCLKNYEETINLRERWYGRGNTNDS